MSSQRAQIRCDERMREEMRTGLIEEARSGKDGIPHAPQMESREIKAIHLLKWTSSRGVLSSRRKKPKRLVSGVDVGCVGVGEETLQNSPFVATAARANEVLLEESPRRPTNRRNLGAVC